MLSDAQYQMARDNLNKWIGMPPPRYWQEPGLAAAAFVDVDRLLDEVDRLNKVVASRENDLMLMGKIEFQLKKQIESMGGEW